MARTKTAKTSESSNVKKIRPATTPEARENQMISLAVDLAEKQLLEGTASSQVITHYLKLGTTRERLEKELLEREVELKRAKTEMIQANQIIEALYEEAISAMKRYGGHGDSDEC